MTRSRTMVSSFLMLGVMAGVAAAPVHAQGGLFQTKPTGGVVAPPPPPPAGIVVAPPVPTPAVTQPNPPAADPFPGVGVIVKPDQPFLQAEANPRALDMGTVRAYKNELKTAVVTVRSPTDGTVAAGMEPANPFQVLRITSFEDGAPYGGTSIDSVAQPLRRERKILQSVPGGESLSVKAGQSVEVEVSLQAAANTPSQVQSRLFVSGHQWTVGVPVRAFVTHVPEISVELGKDELKIAPGGEAQIPVTLTRNLGPNFSGPSGVARNVTITSQNLPVGVTMEPVTVHVPQEMGTVVHTTLRFQASMGAPARRDQLTRFLVDTGENRELHAIAGHVYPFEKQFKYQHGAGDVQHEGTLTIRADGTWKWDAHLNDTGTVVGDHYFVGVMLRLFETKLFGGNRGEVIPVEQPLVLLPTFEVGVLGGGVFGGSKTRDIHMSHEGNPSNMIGPSASLKQHYCDAVDAGIKIETKALGDVGPVVEWTIGSMWKVISGLISPA